MQLLFGHRKCRATYGGMGFEFGEVLVETDNVFGVGFSGESFHVIVETARSECDESKFEKLCWRNTKFIVFFFRTGPLG